MLAVFLLLLLMLSPGRASSYSYLNHQQYDENPGDYELSATEEDKIFSNTLKMLLNKEVSAHKNKPMYSDIDHIVQSPVDDVDLDLIRNYNENFDKTGQLRYDSVPVIEDELVKELLGVIFGRKEYSRYLNNPKREHMEIAVREMLRLPSQQVLQQQLLHKILASRAYYVKFIEPLIENDKRQRLLEFADHLLRAHANGTLSTNDTIQFSEKMKNYAFFDRPDDVEFRQKVDQLQEMFGKSMNVTTGKSNEGINGRNTPFIPDTVVNESDDDDISEEWPDFDSVDAMESSTVASDNTADSTSTVTSADPTVAPVNITESVAATTTMTPTTTTKVTTETSTQLSSTKSSTAASTYSTETVIAGGKSEASKMTTYASTVPIAIGDNVTSSNTVSTVSTIVPVVLNVTTEATTTTTEEPFPLVKNNDAVRKTAKDSGFAAKA